MDLNKIFIYSAVSSIFMLTACENHIGSRSKFNNYLQQAEISKKSITQDVNLKKLKASKWNIVGNSNFSKASVDNQRLLIAPDGTKYIAFRDFSTDPKGQITVMYNKDDKQNWQVLGNSGFSTGQVDSVNMVADANGKIYVSYKDSGLSEKAIVMYYSQESKQWQMLGGKPASAAKADSTTIAINPINNQVYLAYSDYSADRNGFAKVVKFDGSGWVNVGNKDYVLSNRVTDNSLAFDKQGKLYLAFSDKGFAMGRAAVMAYNSSSNSWDHMGSPGLSQGAAGSITLLAGPDNTLYLASNMQVDGIGVHVLYYDKDIENWTSLGGKPVFEKYSFNVSMAIGPDNKIYVGYRDPNDGSHANVATFDDKSKDWKSIGTSLHVSPSNADYIAVAVDKDGLPYIAYSDLSTDGKGRAIVLSYSVEKIEQFATGSEFQCVLKLGKIYCKGDNVYGQLGIGNSQSDFDFTLIEVSDLPESDRKFIHVVAGEDHACAITASGRAYCWGDNSYGELGDNTYHNRNKPSLVDISDLGNIKFTNIATRDVHTCAITDSGKIYCWGFNYYCELGDGDCRSSRIYSKSKPVLVDTSNVGNVQFNAVSLGELHTCAIATNGKTYCWGRNDSGQLGNSDVYRLFDQPTLVDTNSIGNIKFSTLTAGSLHTCAITPSGNIYCWGNNVYGQLGDGSNVDSTKPVLVNTSEIGDIKFVSISAGSWHTCAIAINGKTYCWGLNKEGKLGDGTKISKNKPVLVNSSSYGDNIEFIQIALYGYQSCAVTREADIHCWGSQSLCPEIFPRSIGRICKYQTFNLEVLLH